jgi:hypothetical protein
MDESGANLELRVRAGTAEREALRSQLLEQLAQRFAASGLDPKDGRRAGFS